MPLCVVSWMYLQPSSLHPLLLCFSLSLHQQRTGRRPIPYTTSQQQTSMATWFLWRNIGSSLLQAFSLSVYGCISRSNSSANVFCACRGNVVIITNVASKWGKTPVNYSQFADMHARYAERGLRILAFPSNQFGNQVSNNWNQDCVEPSIIFTDLLLVTCKALIIILRGVGRLCLALEIIHIAGSLDVFSFEGAGHWVSDQTVCTVLQCSVWHVQQNWCKWRQCSSSVEVAQRAAQWRRLPGEVS